MFQLKRALEEDVPFLVEGMISMVTEIQKFSNEPFINNLDKEYPAILKNTIEQTLDSNNEVIFILEMEGKQLGFIYGKLTSPYLPISRVKKVGEIVACWVQKIYRGRKFSGALVDEMEKWFKEKGIQYVEINYIAGSYAAENAWINCGYMPFRMRARKKLSSF